MPLEFYRVMTGKCGSDHKKILFLKPYYSITINVFLILFEVYWNIATLSICILYGTNLFCIKLKYLRSILLSKIFWSRKYKELNKQFKVVYYVYCTAKPVTSSACMYASPSRTMQRERCARRLAVALPKFAPLSRSSVQLSTCFRKKS